MKTIEVIDRELADLRKQSIDAGKKEMKKIQSGAALRNKAMQCLRAGITQPSLERQLGDAEKALSRIKAGFDAWKQAQQGIGNIQDPKSKYEREMGAKVCRDQIKLMKYLLS